MYTCPCVYTCHYVYTYPYVHVPLCTYVPVYTHVPVSTFPVYTYIPVYTHVSECTSPCVYMFLCVWVTVYTCPCMYTRSSVHVSWCSHVSAYVCLCMNMFLCVPLCGGQRSTSIVIPQPLSTLLHETRSLTDLGTCCQPRPSGLETPGKFGCPSLQCRESLCHHTQLFIWALGSNSGLPGLQASTLLPELSPPQSLIILKTIKGTLPGTTMFENHCSEHFL